MLKTIIGFFKQGVSVAGISRWAIVSLLLVTFSLGMLLVVTMSDRTVIAGNLKNAESTLKQKDKTIEEQKGKLRTLDTEVSGCLGQIEQLNKGIAEQALAQAEKDRKGGTAAEAYLGTLAGTLVADRGLAATPALTTAWLQNLLK